MSLGLNPIDIDENYFNNYTNTIIQVTLTNNLLLYPFTHKVSNLLEGVPCTVS